MSAADNVRYTCPACLAVFRTAFARCPLDGALLAPFVEDPLLGATIADRYVVESCVGEGAIGRVYRARHLRVSRHFAIKVLFGDHLADKKMQARFAREADAASRLQHPNVVPVIDFGETADGVLYLVMDLVEGIPLSELIEREAPLERQRIAPLLRQLCGGLAHAHERNLIHRDFKPDNVLVTGARQDEILRIADFGLAVLLEPEGAPSRLTTDGMVVGTPAYIAPEQATQQAVDHRTDLFSLGLTLYELLAGVLPFEGAALELARKNLNDDPPPVAERAPHAPGDAALESIALRLMAKDPADRYQSAREVIQALDRVGGENAPAQRGAGSLGEAEGAAARAKSAPGARREIAETEGPDPAARIATDATDFVAERAFRRRRAPLLAFALGGAAVLGAGGILMGSIGDAPGPASPAPTRDARAAPSATKDASRPRADASSGRVRFRGGDAGSAAREDARPESSEPAASAGGKERGGRDRKEADARASGRREAAKEQGERAQAERGKEPGRDANGDERGPSGREDGGVSRDALTYRYRTVGAALQGLDDSPEAEELREAYLALPYGEAQRDAARRRDVYRKLGRISSELRRLNAEP